MLYTYFCKYMWGFHLRVYTLGAWIGLLLDSINLGDAGTWGYSETFSPAGILQLQAVNTSISPGYLNTTGTWYNGNLCNTATVSLTETEEHFQMLQENKKKYANASWLTAFSLEVKLALMQPSPINSMHLQFCSEDLRFDPCYIDAVEAELKLLEFSARVQIRGCQSASIWFRKQRQFCSKAWKLYAETKIMETRF